MNRDEAIVLLREHVKTEYTIKHCLAVGAIMKGVAEEINEPSQKWEIAGILHDIDLDKCEKDYSNHGTLAMEILSNVILDQEILDTIKSHAPEYTKSEPKSKMDFAIIAADAISGLIIATAIMQPSKKLADVTAESIAKKFKKKDFARNCNRENILFCEKIGIDRNKFYEIALKSLQVISGELGL